MTGVAITDLFTPATEPEWLAKLLATADVLGLTTTAWQSGSPERTILQTLSRTLNYEDATVSLIAQGGFLDFAASGTTTYMNADGTMTIVAVTPEGGPGWLDALASSVYDTTRISATYAGGPEAIINTSVSTYGPFAANTYHVADPHSNATYSNTTSLTITPSTAVGSGVSGVVASGTLIKITTNAVHGLSTGDVVGIVGVVGVTPLATTTAWYIDVINTTSFTLRGSTFAGSYVSGGTVYVPTVATFIADAIGSASSSVDAAWAINTHTVTQTVTSLVGVAVDNLAAFRGSDVETNIALAARCRLKLQSLSINGPAGAYDYAAKSSQQLAPLLSPPLEVAQAITRAEEFTDKLTGSVAVWIANASGAPSAADVTATGAVVAAYATPLAVTATVAAATQKTVAAVADVWVPAALNNAATVALFQNAIELYFSVLPIGGLTDPNGAYTHVVPFDAVLGAIFTAGLSGGVAVQQATLTLNGGTANIALVFTLASAEVVVLSPAAPTVTLHSV